MECLRKAERLDPARADRARMWMALTLERQHKPAEAEALYKAALAAAKQALTPAQEKVDSQLRRLAWPDQGEARAVAPLSVPPTWQAGEWLHVYVRLHSTS